MINDLVSVIITTYKRNVDLIMQAVDSVRQQSYNPIEIIIVDDNGLNTEYQCKNYELFSQDSGIKYIVNVHNSGAQYSRNIGFLESQGEYVAFLDDDDLWVPDKIEKQVRFLKENNLDMVFCNGYRFYNNDINNRRLYQFNFISDSLLSYDSELISDRIGSTSHPLMKRTCIAKSGLFDIDMPARQDYEMWLRICKYCKVQGLDEPLFFYRYHDSERITHSPDKAITSYLLLWRKYRNSYKKNRQARARIQLTMATEYLKMKRYFRFIYHFTYSLLSAPSVFIEVLSNHKHNKPAF